MLFLLVVCLFGLSEDAEPTNAAVGPELQLVSFSVERTISPGGAASATPSCRNGFSFLASRFRPIAVKPSGATPSFETVAVVPKPRGARLSFRNTGMAVVTILATADCVKLTGKPSLRTTVLARAVRFGARLAGRAHSAAPRTLALACRLPNSIPGDVGFAAGGNGLENLSYFRDRRGRVGVRAALAGGEAGMAKLFLSCVQGRGVRLGGRVAGPKHGSAGSSRAMSRGTSSAGRLRIVVRYFVDQTKLFADSPFAGLNLALSDSSDVLWGDALQFGDAGPALAGRGFLAADDSTRANPRWTPFYLRYGIDKMAFEEILGASKVVRTAAIGVVDRRVPGRLGDFVAGGEGGSGREFSTSKTVGPLSLSDACVEGFYVDIYIPAYAEEPIGHQILDNDPPCESATIEVEKFANGYRPPGTAPGDSRWQNHKTYRVKIKGGRGDEKPFRIKVTWRNPPDL